MTARKHGFPKATLKKRTERKTKVQLSAHNILGAMGPSQRVGTRLGTTKSVFSGFTSSECVAMISYALQVNLQRRSIFRTASTKKKHKKYTAFIK
jgi:hypothetical protein